ncbi:MAG: ComF family protein [Chitinophagaceae bacterium]|nr:ComF family protein [Chitinophagaceae bacterium]
MLRVKQWLTDFSLLLFPHHCAGCGSDLLQQDQSICHNCYTNLPETGFAPHAGNPIEKIFYGRADVHEAMAGYYFTKQSALQHIIHALKYKNNTEAGLQMGRWMGLQLNNSNRFKHLDALISLPLFPEKEKKRGYNQAAVLCEGISEIINVPVVNNFVIRKRYTDTQTKKGRSERWANVDGSFEVTPHHPLTGKRVLLVDDVITTGATLEACGAAVTETGTKLSIAVLAWASDD